MLKRDLTKAVSRKTEGYLKKDIDKSIDLIFEGIAQSLAENRRVEIRGFGSFSVRERKARTAKNPKTGAEMHIPRRKTVHFTMSKTIKQSLLQENK